MKLRHAVITAGLMLLSIAALTAGAAHNNFRLASAQGPGRGPGGPPDRRPPGPPEFPLRRLELTETQKEQIKAIAEAEDAKVESDLKQLDDARQALDDAAAKGQFNETQIRAIATSQAQAMIELTVSKARKDAAIYQVLTPEQRAQLDQFRATHRPPEAGGRPPRPPQ